MGVERRQPKIFHCGSSGGGFGAEEVPGGVRGAVHYSVGRVHSATLCCVGHSHAMDLRDRERAALGISSGI